MAKELVEVYYGLNSEDGDLNIVKASERDFEKNYLSADYIYDYALRLIAKSGDSGFYTREEALTKVKELDVQAVWEVVLQRKILLAIRNENPKQIKKVISFLYSSEEFDNLAVVESILNNLETIISEFDEKINDVSVDDEHYLTLRKFKSFFTFARDLVRDYALATPEAFEYDIQGVLTAKLEISEKLFLAKDVVETEKMRYSKKHKKIEIHRLEVDERKNWNADKISVMKLLYILKSSDAPKIKKMIEEKSVESFEGFIKFKDLYTIACKVDQKTAVAIVKENDLHKSVYNLCEVVSESKKEDEISKAIKDVRKSLKEARSMFNKKKKTERVEKQIQENLNYTKYLLENVSIDQKVNVLQALQRRELELEILKTSENQTLNFDRIRAKILHNKTVIEALNARTAGASSIQKALTTEMKTEEGTDANKKKRTVSKILSE